MRSMESIVNEIATEAAESAPIEQPPCPHVRRSGEGTAYCELAETGIRVFERLAKENEQKALDWQHEFNMYRRAWLRELGGKLIPKSHDIDAFVLTTRRMREELERLRRPVPMILHCPKCGKRHVDEAKPDACETCGQDQSGCACPAFTAWLNPPHKSHRCAFCNLVWRPADVPTSGVASIETRGERDTWPDGAEASSSDA